MTTTRTVVRGMINPIVRKVETVICLSVYRSNDYTATYARNPSLAGGDPFENFTNRSYKGKSVKTANKQDMLSVFGDKG